MLDAQILAEVYLAMTGGQAALSLEAETPSEARKRVRASADRSRGSCSSWSAADAEELAAHEAMLARIRERCGGPTLWDACRPTDIFEMPACQRLSFPTTRGAPCVDMKEDQQRTDRWEGYSGHGKLALTDAMIASGVVLALTFIGIFSEHSTAWSDRKWRRSARCAMVIVGQVFGFYTPMQAIEAVDWNVIFLLAAMMTIVSIMIPTGGFNWLAYKLAAMSKGRQYIMLVLIGTAVTVHLAAARQRHDGRDLRPADHPDREGAEGLIRFRICLPRRSCRTRAASARSSAIRRTS